MFSPRLPLSRGVLSSYILSGMCKDTVYCIYSAMPELLMSYIKIALQGSLQPLMRGLLTGGFLSSLIVYSVNRFFVSSRRSHIEGCQSSPTITYLGWA